MKSHSESDVCEDLERNAKVRASMPVMKSKSEKVMRRKMSLELNLGKKGKAWGDFLVRKGRVK